MDVDATTVTAQSPTVPWVPRLVRGVALFIVLKGVFLLFLLFAGGFIAIANKSIATVGIGSWLTEAFLLCDAAAQLIAAWGISNRRNWARWLYLLWEPVSLANQFRRSGLEWNIGVSLAVYCILFLILTRPQISAWFPAGRKPTRAFLMGGGIAYGLGLVSLIIVGVLTCDWNIANARLTEAGLGPLPASATEVRSYRWRGMFTGESYVSFRASPEDIDRFLQQSQVPQHSELKALPIARERTPPRFLRGPEWFAPSLQSKGRWYDFASSGSVIVDDEHHVVWIVAIRG